MTRATTTMGFFAAALMAVSPLTAPPALARPAAAAAPAASADPSVIAEWNAIASRVIFDENLTPVPSSGLYFGITSTAVYDAVVTIEGGFRPAVSSGALHRGASSAVAAVTAAHRVLSNYFPNSVPGLDASYQASLTRLPGGWTALVGRLVGEAVAALVIRSRQNDGRNAPITLNVTPAPGVWRPTPDAFAPMIVPWLGFVRPLALTSPKQFFPPGPYPIDSATYAKDWAEVKAYGAKDGSVRTAEQTQIALFWNANSVSQYQAALRDQVTRRHWDITRSARAFALLGVSTGDTMISCWRAKYEYASWRPITAIREADTDANPATDSDPAWTPLVQTPPYPEYASGHACITSAASGTFGDLFGQNAIDLDVYSSVTGTTRHFATVSALDEETKNARIWLGLHFRKGMNDASQLGHSIEAWIAAHRFGAR